MTQVVIRWNGMGTPILLNQRLRVEPGRSYRLIADIGDSEPALLRSIYFALNCPGADPARFEKPVRDNEAAVTVFSTDKPVNCSFPDLVLQGSGLRSGTPVEIRLSELRMKPA